MRASEGVDRVEELEAVQIMKRPLAAITAAVFAAQLSSACPFLFLKTGEKFATQELAGPTVEGLTMYVGEKLDGMTNSFSPRVFNDPIQAVEFCAAKKPGLGIVTPGFYLAYAKALGMEPLLEVQRERIPSERYVLVARADAGEDFSEKIIATTLAAEERYVNSVILQGKYGRDVRLKSVADVEVAVFDLVEGAKGAADAVLMEEAAWSLFKDDAELGPKLKVVYRSQDLPRPLVVVFRPHPAEVDAQKLKGILKEMSGSEQGRRVLKSIRVEAFVEMDKERLAKATSLYHGK